MRTQARMLLQNPLLTFGGTQRKRAEDARSVEKLCEKVIAQTWALLTTAVTNVFILTLPQRSGQKNAKAMTRVITQNGNNINFNKMANQATTELRISGTRKAVSDLWNALQSMNVNTKNVWLDELARYYGIDHEAKHISVRAHIYWAEYEEDEENDTYLLSLETETAWDRSELFEEISHILWDEISVSYRVTECGCDVYYVHDEGNYFPEEACVSSSGEPFEDACDEIYDSVADAIKVWCEKMNIEQGERTDEEMMDFINEYEYENDDTYFYIRTFIFE